MSEFMGLPPKERIKRYLDLANDARAEADCAKGPARQTYLRIVEQWEQMAADTAKRIDQPTDLNPAMGQTQSRLVKVLVVEDDAVSHRIVVGSLQRRGFEVVHAKNAAEAIGILQNNDDIAVVFSDVVMPGEIDGAGLQDWLRINRPGLPVVLGSANPAKAKASSHEEFRFFTKPYNMNAVAACIRSLVGASPSEEQGSSTAR